MVRGARVRLQVMRQTSGTLRRDRGDARDFAGFGAPEEMKKPSGAAA